MQETYEPWVRCLGQDDLLEEELATHSRILPGEPHGQRATVHGAAKGQT